MTDAEQLAIVRHRLETLEIAILELFDVWEDTAKERDRAWKGLQTAMKSDFSEAVISSVELSEKERQRWLDVAGKGET